MGRVWVGPLNATLLKAPQSGANNRSKTNAAQSCYKWTDGMDESPGRVKYI